MAPPSVGDLGDPPSPGGAFSLRLPPLGAGAGAGAAGGAQRPQHQRTGGAKLLGSESAGPVDAYGALSRPEGVWFAGLATSHSQQMAANTTKQPERCVVRASVRKRGATGARRPRKRQCGPRPSPRRDAAQRVARAAASSHAQRAPAGGAAAGGRGWPLLSQTGAGAPQQQADTPSRQGEERKA